ncbi:hypothetical protein BDQ17DRAFT_1330714 [Cyathus striatus]|nr:hypothetical protein BDQ17DRAFT_1330714 [Cyathus striatus]
MALARKRRKVLLMLKTSSYDFHDVKSVEQEIQSNYVVGYDKELRAEVETGEILETNYKVEDAESIKSGGLAMPSQITRTIKPSRENSELLADSYCLEENTAWTDSN